DVKALNNLGLSYEAQNRVADALRAYQDAMTAQRDATHPNEQPLLNFGTLLIAQNRAGDAIGTLEQAVRLAPNDPKCHEELARAYLYTERLSQAREQLEAAIALDPQNSRLHFQLGRLYKRLGLIEQADAELKLSAQLYGTQSSPEGK
ncbi:MAG TPA: tetratricopeptide repeat protein, partial [Edaphobacter sp.]